MIHCHWRVIIQPVYPSGVLASKLCQPNGCREACAIRQLPLDKQITIIIISTNMRDLTTYATFSLMLIIRETGMPICSLIMFSFRPVEQRVWSRIKKSATSASCLILVSMFLCLGHFAFKLYCTQGLIKKHYVALIQKCAFGAILTICSSCSLCMWSITSKFLLKAHCRLHMTTLFHPRSQ